VTKPEELTILIVDDSPVYRKLVEKSLAEESCTLLFARDGRQAIELFAKHLPAVVITDWTMPDISGIELCEHIRRNMRQLYAYLILVSANTDKEEIIHGLAAGADDYLTKPFHPGELLARVRVGRRIVELHRQIQAKNRLLEEMALTDSLTGLPNRRALDIWATRELGAAARHGFPIWVVMADLDHFKAINDGYGHESGDMALKAFAEILQTNTRQSNMCGRMGGEEFIVVLTHLERDHVAAVVERIRKQLEALMLAFGELQFRATCSFGVAGFCGTKPPEFSALVKRADAALYSAKEKGRNRVEFAN
jgi:two-component system, cell cycle response regulator